MEKWSKVISLLLADNHEVIQVGITGEKILHDYIFDAPLDKLKDLLYSSDTFISVDNFFPHFAHYYNFRGVVIFSRSAPQIYGYPENLNLLKDLKYLRHDQFGLWESCDPIPESFVEPELVIKAVNTFK